jgi:thiamine-monophosphate kinase
MDERLTDLGEAELLRRLAAWAPAGQFDDDAALLEERSGRLLVINTDVLVEGVHFSDATMGATDLGWRAAAANLSDLAAMGCRRVVGLTVGLVAPGATPWSWVAGVYDGLAEALHRYGGSLLGGDCCRGDQRLLAVTALGHVGEGPIRRGDGRPGDRLVSTGSHGLSRLGLALLRQDPEISATGLEGSPLAARAVASHRRPRPRFDAVAALEVCRPGALPWRVGGCDSSDGLLASVAAIASASGCTALLDRQRLPQDPDLAPLEGALPWCLEGGEDFELVLALPAPWAEALCRQLPGCSLVGELQTTEHPSGAGEVLWSHDRSPVMASGAGFHHFG